jgi:hypothetical protein
LRPLMWYDELFFELGKRVITVHNDLWYRPLGYA